MDDPTWKLFLSTSRRMLGKGESLAWASESWCAWTTFASLEHELTYWACGLLDENDLLDSRTVDGSIWRQSFDYNDLAHFIIPSKFYWERVDDSGLQNGYKMQDIGSLSLELNLLNIPHRKTALVLEIKLY
jgi:hypothetical protein